MVLSVVKSYGMNYRANGEKVGDWKDVPLHEAFNRLGKALQHPFGCDRSLAFLVQVLQQYGELVAGQPRMKAIQKVAANPNSPRQSFLKYRTFDLPK